MNKGAVIRAVLLITLVLTGIALSYFIWRGKTEYEAINVKETEKAAIDSPRKISQIFRPIYLQLNSNDTHYQSNASSALDSFVTKGRNFNFSEFVLSGGQEIQDYSQIIHQEETVEVVFPSSVPFSIFSQAYQQIEGKDLTSGLFNRIIFVMKATDTGLYTVYFANDYDLAIYQSSLQQKDMNTLKKIVNTVKGKKELTKTPQVVGEEHPLYLSSKPLKIDSEKFIIDTLDMNLFTKSLFPNSGAVKNEGNSYTDGASKINLDPKNKMLAYINPSQELMNPEYISKEKRIAMVQDSFNFINEHSGWTGNFIYTSYEKNTGTTTFNLFVNNLQVVNGDGMASLSVVQGRENVYKYVRPFFKLDSQIPRERKAVELPSSLKIYNQLKQRKDIQTNKIQMIVPGYRMSWAENEALNRVVQLTPTWLYRYKGEWKDANAKGDK